MKRNTLGGAHGYDAIVVGARVAGAATAMLLARRGLRVLMVDRRRPGSDTLSTHALMRGGVLQLSRWGLLDRVIAAGTPAVTQTVLHYGDTSETVAIRPKAGVPSLFAPRRTVLDPILVDAAEEEGVDVRYGVTEPWGPPDCHDLGGTWITVPTTAPDSYFVAAAHRNTDITVEVFDYPCPGRGAPGDVDGNRSVAVNDFL